MQRALLDIFAGANGDKRALAPTEVSARRQRGKETRDAREQQQQQQCTRVEKGRHTLPEFVVCVSTRRTPWRTRARRTGVCRCLIERVDI